MVLGICCGLGASALCCAGSCLSSMCCCCSTTVKPSAFPRLMYVIFQLFFMFLSFVMMFTIKAAVDEIGIITCAQSSGQGALEDDQISSACFGISAVLRMSFSLFIFHLTILLCIIWRAECSSVIHDGFWCCKYLIMGVMFTCFFFIHVDFFDVWMEICRYLSIAFLLMQSIYMVSSSFSFNDYMKQAYSDQEDCGNWVMLILAIILNVGAIVITSLCCVWFLGSSTP